MFVNFSNHSSDKWSLEQINEAKKYGEIVDIDFPILSPTFKEEDIKRIGDECVDIILSYNPQVVMCQGEFTLIFYVVSKLMKEGVVCVAACTERVVTEKAQVDGIIEKESLFKFSGFRKYTG